MRVYASLKNSSQTPDGNTYTAIFGDADAGQIMGIQCAVFASPFGDIYIPMDAINSAMALSAELENAEMGAHVLVL